MEVQLNKIIIINLGILYAETGWNNIIFKNNNFYNIT